MQNTIFPRERIMRAVAFLMAITMCFWLCPIGIITSRAEAGEYITGITLMQGDLSAESLAESGYSVMGQPLNPAGTPDLYLGYQTGGESGAIRDLMVSSSGSGTIEVEGVSYQKVSDISLNKGAGGSEIYLYASYEEEAGEALRGLSFLVKKSPDGFEDESQVLASDGSEVVITDEGEPADFDKGIGESEIYLRMYKGNLYRPYVDNVVVATAGSEEAALAKLAVKRCTYYVNYDIGDDKPIYVGYTRTSDEKEALRALVAISGDLKGPGEEILIKDVPYTVVDGGKVKSDSEYTFLMTKDETAGEPVIDLIACGYDPDESELTPKSEKAEEPIETEEPVETEENGEVTDTNSEQENTSDDTSDSGDDSGSDASDKGDSVSGAGADLEGGSEPGGSDDTAGASESGDSVDDAATDPDDENISGSDDLEPSEDEDVNESDEEELKLADGIRVYSETTMKEWISGYFLRGGGQTASKYLYEESAYTSAKESDEKLWISNIYCSGKNGRQFVNYIGYVSAPGMADSCPFTEAVSCDDVKDKKDKAKDEAESTASVFGSNMSILVMISIIVIMMGVILGSLVYRKRKKTDTNE